MSRVCWKLLVHMYNQLQLVLLSHIIVVEHIGVNIYFIAITCLLTGRTLNQHWLDVLCLQVTHFSTLQCNTN